MYDFPMVTIQTNSTQRSSTLLIGSKMANLLELQHHEIINLFTGKIAWEVTISISERLKNKKTIYLSPELTRKMYLRTARTYGISKQHDGIHIGPVVGIMAEVHNKKERPFGGQSFFFREVIKTGKRLGQICFGFSPKSINWDRKIVRGYTYGKNGWVSGVFPIPDVVYPREPGYSDSIQRVRRKLQDMGCKFINPGLIGKWQTYKILSQNQKIAPYLPETKLISSFHQVGQMVNRHKAVYMKPVTGSRGRNIIKVVRNKGIYQYQYQMNNRMSRGTVNNVASLRNSLRRVMGNRSYIIQKQINLLRSQGNVLDVRVMVQKDNTGNWKITGNICRIGKTGSITSNISSGGHAARLSTILARKFSDPAIRQKIESEVRMVALEAAQTLESSVNYIGELGIDIGIDTSGRVWFIEANLKPARQVFILIGDRQGRRDSIERPLLYSRYLAGFK